MKRTALIIMVLSITGFSLCALMGVSYAEDMNNSRFAKEFAALYREVSQQMDPNTAAVFKDEVRKALETMPNLKKEIARFEDENSIRKESYDIVARERIIEREEQHGNAGGGGNTPIGGGSESSNRTSGESFQTNNNDNTSQHNQQAK